jgi:hypothetical protein
MNKEQASCPLFCPTLKGTAMLVSEDYRSIASRFHNGVANRHYNHTYVARAARMVYSTYDWGYYTEYVNQEFRYQVVRLGVNLEAGGLIEVELRPNQAGFKSKTVAMKLTKFLRRLLRADVVEHLTNADFEMLNNEWEACCELYLEDLNPSFELLSGEDIRWAYFCNNYTEREHSQLHSSCMSYDYAQAYLNIYVENPDRIQLLVRKDKEDKIMARCLIWKGDDGGTYYDRIYASDVTIRSMDAYCIDQGWRPSYDCISGVSLKHARHHYYPYMDNMIYLTLNNDDSGYLNPRRGNYVLNSTGGGPLHHSRRCDNCDETMDEDDAYSFRGNTYCEACYSERTVYSEWEGDSIDASDAVTVYTEQQVAFGTRILEDQVTWYTAHRSGQFAPCSECDDIYENSLLLDVDGNDYCPDCEANVIAGCVDCEESFYYTNINDDDLCLDCAIKRKEAEERAREEEEALAVAA